LAFTRFPGVPLQPLEHLSLFRPAKVKEVFGTAKRYLKKLYPRCMGMLFSQLHIPYTELNP
ncbi:MAG: hypothetical protein Q4D36_07390, partial [Bacteroidales bacterium]|nr:hypothetical protein [Bacteroidales bacterium]